MNAAAQILSIYPDLHRNYTVPRKRLPRNFRHRELMDLGRHRIQKTDSSCGRSMAEIAMKVQGIEFNPSNPSHHSWLRSYVPTKNIGIDPKPLAKAIKSIGVQCREYDGASVSQLVRELKKGNCICILNLQAPWCAIDDILTVNAGHYVAAGHVNLKTKEIYVHDTGHSRPWGRIKIEHLEHIWYDCYVKGKNRTFHNWFLKVPINTSLI